MGPLGESVLLACMPEESFQKMKKLILPGCTTWTVLIRYIRQTSRSCGYTAVITMGSFEGIVFMA